jgi:hypothetical protein
MIVVRPLKPTWSIVLFEGMADKMYALLGICLFLTSLNMAYVTYFMLNWYEILYILMVEVMKFYFKV